MNDWEIEDLMESFEDLQELAEAILDGDLKKQIDNKENLDKQFEEEI